MSKRLGKRIIIGQDQLKFWMGGKLFEDLGWEKAPEPRNVKIVKYGDGWTHCQTHGFEKLFVSTDIVKSQALSRGHSCQLFMVIRSREAFTADPIYLNDPRIYELEFSIRDSDDLMPHPQQVAFVPTGRRGHGNRGN